MSNLRIMITIPTTIRIIPTMSIRKQYNVFHKLKLEKLNIEVTLNKEINKHYFKERFQDEDCIILDIW